MNYGSQADAHARVMTALNAVLASKRTQAERDAYLDRLEASLEELHRRREAERRNIDRRVVDGGCVVLRPHKWR
jgi:hypothetical protein